MRRSLVSLVVAGVALLALALTSGTAAAQAPPFQKVPLIEDTENPFELDIANDGRVFYIERWGDLRVWDPETEEVETIGHLDVYTGQENGLMGLALAPDFALSNQLYLAYSVPPQNTNTQRVSRFTLDSQGQLDLTSEEVIYEWTHQRDECCHSAAALEFGPDGSLYISTGDNTNPFESDGYAPIDERPGREAFDAQRTSANTNDPNGKILRILPNANGPGYTIPAGNMFEPGAPQTLPEIYAMGFRNPFRFKVDPETGWVLMGDYGPDAGSSNPDRGPQGSVEYNVVTEPGFFGWPYCVRVNTPYIDYDFETQTSGAPFDCENPVNDSPNNTGRTELPPAVPATMWMGYSEQDERFPELGTGGAPMGGPIYHYDPENPAETKFPEEYDGKWFIGEWNNSWIKTVTLDEEGNATAVEEFPDLGYRRPMDMKFGPDGSLYLIEWGANFDGGQAGNPDSGVYRIDYVEPTGPQVTASADPRRGTAPLEVSFDGEATNPDGSPNPSFEYEWDFGDGSPTSDEEDPTHTYEEPGTYEATLSVTDPETEEVGTATVTIRVDQQQQCPRGPRSDEFDGDALDESKWTVIRPDDTHPFSVSDGELHLPIDNGSIYGPGTSARNIIVQPLPSGEVTVTAKVRVDELSENYHQAGLRVYADDDNWASVHMIHAGGQRDIEFIWEANGNPRNEAADKLGGIPDQAPLEYYVRLISDGEELRAEYSFDGETFNPVGRPGSLETFDNPQVGPVALSDAAPTVPMSHFDWIRFDPDAAADSGPSDEFEGTTLDKSRWNAIVRENPDTWNVADGQLTITTEMGDLYTGDTNPPPNNIMLQSPDNAGEDWTIETKLSGTINDGYSQAGLMAYVGGDDYVKFNAIADVGAGRINRIELRSEVDQVVQNPQPNADVPEGTTDIWLRLTKEGDTYTGEYSFDGEDWTEMDDPVSNPMEAPSFGLFAFGVQEEGDEVSFDYFRVDGQPGGGGCVCLIPADEFDGDALDPQRWNANVREDPELYRFEEGTLWIETTPGDIYQNGDPADTRNFLLQSASNAGADWTIETKVLGGNLEGGYAQGGLLAYLDDDNYVKLDLISDEGSPQVNRIELRSEVDGQIVNPQPQLSPLPDGTEDAWLRLTKEGETYTGEYSFDGENWTALDQSVTNPMEAPAFGIFTLGVNVPGPEVGFEYFGFEGEGNCPEDNRPPAINEVSATPSGGFAPLEVDFQVDASDPDGDELTYEWDFGDGNTSDEQNPTHTYTEAGEYDAEVTVSDGDIERSRSVTVTVLPEDDPEARFRALVFSKTAGFRHDSIPAGHDAMDALADEHNFQVDHTEDSTLFRPEILEHYDTVVFLSTTGDVLNDDQQAAFEEYIQGGGGYVGIHAGSDTEYDWNWYGHLVGAYFLSHPPGTTNAAVDVEDHNHPSTASLPDRYERVDEWYNFKSPDFQDVGEDDYSPRGDVHVLATVDESTYDEQDGNATDDDHPITWCQRYEGGRSWYTGMGHTIESFSEENFLTQVLGGLETTAGVTPSEECGVAPGADTTDPETTASLNPEDPGPGGTYDGPVEVTLSATDPGAGSGPAEPQNHDVQAEPTSWDPDTLEISEGDTVTWHFDHPPAQFSHDVWLIPPDGEDRNDAIQVTDGLQPVNSPPVSYTFEETGEWTVYCSIHTTFTNDVPTSGMVGTINVSPPGAEVSGVAYTEYRVNTDGATGEWVRADNDAGDDPFVTTFTVEDAGDHVVQFRSTDNAGNRETTKSVEFSIDDGSGPCVERSDEFELPELDTGRWSFQHPTSGDPTVAGGSLILPLGALELDEANTGPIGLLGQPIPDGDFEVVGKFTGDIAGDDTGENGYAQAGLILYQGDDNFVKASHTRVGIFQPDIEGQTYYEAGAETDGTIVRSGQLGLSDSNPDTWWLQIKREGDQLTASYATSDPDEGGEWTEIPVGSGMNINSIMPPGNGTIYAGVYGGNGSTDVEVDYVRFTPDQECPEEPDGEPELRANATPKKRTVPRKRKQVAFRVRARNVGDAATGPLKICAKYQGKRLRAVGGKCRKVKALDAGQRLDRRIKFRIKRGAIGKRTKIRFVVGGKGVKNQTATVTLRVKRR
jgi:PKD repeat protein/glucose/arabinose dehydrogenase/plastocyanin